MTNNFGIRFDFDIRGEPPNVFIADENGRGVGYVEVHEAPALLCDEWTDYHQNWEAGPIAKALVDFMNSAEYADAAKAQGRAE